MGFTQGQAKDLALLIEGGALPLQVEQISSSTVGPTLGEAAIDASGKAGILGLILTLCGFFFKLAVFPFHYWAPDVYQGAPTPITMLIGSAPKLAWLRITRASSRITPTSTRRYSGDP